MVDEKAGWKSRGELLSDQLIGSIAVPDIFMQEDRKDLAIECLG
jgi:hypothetical protein